MNFFLRICKLSGNAELFIHLEEKCTIMIFDIESPHGGVSADDNGSEISTFLYFSQYV